METMKAARIHQYGDPDLLGYEEASVHPVCDVKPSR